MNEWVKSHLAAEGVLRAGINTANFLLVSGRADNGDPVGVAPDMAKDIADRLGARITYVCYKSPGELADAAGSNEWDLGFIGAEPQRAKEIAFTSAYCEIEATYLVRQGAGIESIEDVDRAGTEISVSGRSAYGLWLKRHIEKAQIVEADSMDHAYQLFVDRNLTVLAGLRPRLISDQESIPGSLVLEGKFSAVQQAIGTPRKFEEAVTWLQECVNDAIVSGRVADLIEKHNAHGLSVANQI